LSDLKRAFLLKNNKLKIEVIDETTKKKVEPFKYIGDKVIHKVNLPNQEIDKRMRGFGEIQAELYYHPYKKGSKIIITVRGEPIYLDMCQKIDEFNRYPWNSGMVEGTVEYERLSKQPGRVEIQRDSFYDAFIDMLKILEKEVEIKIKEIEKDLQSKHDEKLFNRLEDVYGRIKREIGLDFFGKPDTKIIKGPLVRIQPFPDKENIEAFSEKEFYIKAYDNEDNELTEDDDIEFSWKVAGNLGTIRQQENHVIFNAGSVVGATEVIVVAKDKKSSKELSCKIEIVIVHPVACGSLYRVRIVPGVVALSINKQRMFRAMAEDMNGNLISNKITYYWKIIYDTSKGAKINNDSRESIIFNAGKIMGQVKLHLSAQQGKTIKEDYALIDVNEVKKTLKSKKNQLGLPLLQKITALEHPMWHSRLDPKEKVLYYNIAHRDYVEVLNNEEKRQRYIANLYAKELTILECRNLGVEYYGERLVEVMSKLDKYWNLKI
jgi:hypothetical protein